MKNRVASCKDDKQEVSDMSKVYLSEILKVLLADERFASARDDYGAMKIVVDQEAIHKLAPEDHWMVFFQFAEVPADQIPVDHEEFETVTGKDLFVKKGKIDGLAYSIELF